MRIADDDNVVGAPEVQLTQDNGVFVERWDPGYPEIREVVEPYTGQSGVRDATQFFGARDVTLRFMVQRLATRSRREFMDLFMQHCQPRARSYIHWQLNDEGDERCVRVRPSRISRPIEKHNRLYINAQFSVPNGLIESSELLTVEIGPSASGTESGRSYDLSFDRTYPPSEPLGGNEITLLGTVPTLPSLIRIDGAITNPKLINITTAQEYSFPAHVVAAGLNNSIFIDPVNRSIVDGLGASLLDELSFTTSSWWELQPGENVMVFEGTSPDASSRATIYYRNAWI